MAIKKYNLVYPEPLRLKVPGCSRISGKTYMDENKQRDLFSGRILIEEKMDGEQRIFTWDRFIFFVEDLMFRRSISYRIPGRFCIFDIFDLERQVFVNNEAKIDILRCLKYVGISIEGFNIDNFFLISLFARGHFDIQEVAAIASWHLSDYAQNSDEIKKITNFTSNFPEGIVIKPDREITYDQAVFGKIIRAELRQGCDFFSNSLSTIPTHEESKESPKTNYIDSTINDLRLLYGMYSFSRTSPHYR